MSSNSAAAHDPRNYSIWNPRAWLMYAPGELATLLWVVGVHIVLVVGLILLPLPPISAFITDVQIKVGDRPVLPWSKNNHLLP